MSNSYKNTSSGGAERIARGSNRLGIGENAAAMPPSGKDNSYEKVLNELDRKDSSALSKGRASDAKLRNK